MNIKRFKGRGNFIAIPVPPDTYGHKIKWSDMDERFSIDYLFSENHRGGFIMWFKDFGGKRKYPKKGTVELIGLAVDIEKSQDLAKLICVPAIRPKFGDPWEYCDPIEAYHRLAQANKIYTVKPCVRKPVRTSPFLHGGFYSRNNVSEMYLLNQGLNAGQESQEHVANWLILKLGN